MCNLWIVAAAALLVSCNSPPAGDGSTADDATGSADIEMATPVAIDFLLVVDNSSSMAGHQHGLGQEFDALISSLVAHRIDYQIAVTTTDNGNDPAVESPANGAFVGPIITADLDEAEAAALFASQVAVGTGGSGVEVGLETALTALTDVPRLSDQITAFLRDEAVLSLLFVSDEEDNTAMPVNEVLAKYYAIRPDVSRAHFRAAALTITTPTACEELTGEAGKRDDFSSWGARYVDVAVQSGGAIGDLCAPDLASVLSAISEASSQPLATGDSGTCATLYDCPMDFYCSGGSCIAGCGADSDCLAGETCSDLGSCQPGACRSAALDCDLGERCDAAGCTETSACGTCEGPDGDCGDAGACVDFGVEGAPDYRCLLGCLDESDPEACPRGLDCRDLSGAGDLYCYADCPVLANEMAKGGP